MGLALFPLEQDSDAPHILVSNLTASNKPDRYTLEVLYYAINLRFSFNKYLMEHLQSLLISAFYTLVGIKHKLGQVTEQVLSQTAT